LRTGVSLCQIISSLIPPAQMNRLHKFVQTNMTLSIISRRSFQRMVFLTINRTQAIIICLELQRKRILLESDEDHVTGFGLHGRIECIACYILYNIVT
jgi:hypothetical protein